MHRSVPRSDSHRHPLDTGHHGGPHPVDVADQFEFGVLTQQYFEEDAGFETSQLCPDARVLSAAECGKRIRIARDHECSTSEPNVSSSRFPEPYSITTMSPARMCLPRM